MDQGRWVVNFHGRHCFLCAPIDGVLPIWHLLSGSACGSAVCTEVIATVSVLPSLILTSCKPHPLIALVIRSGSGTLPASFHRGSAFPSAWLAVCRAGAVAELDAPSKLLENRSSMFSRLVAEYAARSSDMADIARSSSVENLAAVSSVSS